MAGIRLPDSVSQIPETGRRKMRAVVYDRPESFTVCEPAIPDPGPGEVRLRVLVAGVCGRDLHLHHGEFGPTYPLTPGHEFVGEVWPSDRPVLRVCSVSGSSSTTRRRVDAARSAGEPGRRLPALDRPEGNAPGALADFVVTDAARCFMVDDLDPRSPS